MNNPTGLAILLLLLATPSLSFILKKNALPYNVKDSSDYAYLAGLAYCPKKCLDGWSCKSGVQFDLVEVTHINNDITLASCYIGYFRSKNLIVVSFRGSANAQNWIEDFNIEMVSYDCKGCEVHAGFYNDYRVIEAKVDAKVAEMNTKYPTARILTTGHSMGAALSEIAGLRLRQKFAVPVDVHNFGCPRVGNPAMAQFITTRVDSLYRVVHHKDLIPHLPPESAFYHHSAF